MAPHTQPDGRFVTMVVWAVVAVFLEMLPDGPEFIRFCSCIGEKSYSPPPPKTA